MKVKSCLLEELVTDENEIIGTGYTISLVKNGMTLSEAYSGIGYNIRLSITQYKKPMVCEPWAFIL
ncbi:MAG: hypothetical protein SPF70_10730 [Lachnospiraceae bacterium]|nr:hypothetical protein [Lachnospiraceae bacterium]